MEGSFEEEVEEEVEVALVIEEVEVASSNRGTLSLSWELHHHLLLTETFKDRRSYHCLYIYCFVSLPKVDICL